MTQPFYEAQTDVAVGSRGKASDINNIDSAVEQGFKNVHAYGIDSGTSAAYVVTMDTDATAYYDGMVVSFAPDNTNSVQSPTININGLGAKGTFSANQLSGVVEIGEIKTGYVYTFIYYNTVFVLQGSARLNTIPGPIGSGTPSTGAFTTLSATGQITSTLANGTAPLVVASSTVVGNLNVSQLLGATWAAPGTIGSGTPSTGAFTTLSASSTVSGAGFSTYLASPPAIGGTAAAAGKFTLLTATGSLNLTGVADNHFIKYGNALVFNSTGLTGGTEYAGFYSTNAGALVLYGGSVLGSTIKITDYTIELRQSGLADTAILRFAAGSVVGSFNAYNVGETGHSDMTWNANTHAFGVADGMGGTQTELELGQNTTNVTNDLLVGGEFSAMRSTAIPAGGAASKGLLVSSVAGFGIYFGSGVPTVSAAKGSLYLRSDGSTTNDRMYVNTDGGTTWTALITAA